MFPLRSVYLSTGPLRPPPFIRARHLVVHANGLFRNSRFSKQSIFEKGLSKCSVTLACRYIIEKREHSRRASISSRSVRRGWRSEVTIPCFSLESNILNGNSKWMIILQRGMDRAFLKVWWSREYFLDFIETRKYSRLYVCI